MSGRKHRQKGDRIERELVEKHRAIGVFAERYPLSGSSKYKGSGHDVDVYPFGRDQAPLVTEVKGRKNGAGFTLLEKWLGDYDALFLRRDRGEPLVVLPWRVWHQFLYDTVNRPRPGIPPAGPTNALLSRTKMPNRVSPYTRRLQDDPAPQED